MAEAPTDSGQWQSQGCTRREQKTGQRILIAIGVAFTVDLSQKLLGSISVVSEIPTIVSVLLPAILLIFLSLMLLKRA